MTSLSGCRRREARTSRLHVLSRAALLAVIGCVGAWPAAAQGPSSKPAIEVRIENGVVTVHAQDASRAAILDEWARVTGVTVIGRNSVPPERLPLLDLIAVPEGRLLDAVLGDVVGYVSTLRAGPYKPGVSVYDRVYVVPRTPASELAQRKELEAVDASSVARVAPGSAAPNELTDLPAQAATSDPSRPERTMEATPAGFIGAGFVDTNGQDRKELKAPAVGPAMAPGESRRELQAPVSAAPASPAAGR
jgi:hypothetical protein